MANVSNGNVYDAINSFVRRNDARGIGAKPIADYVCSVKRLLLYQDVEIEGNRFRNKVLLPRATEIDDRPLNVEAIRRLLSLGRPNRNMLALVLTLASSGMRLAEAMNLRAGDLDLTRLGDEGVQQIIRERLLVAPDATRGDGQKQKVVTAREAERRRGG